MPREILSDATNTQDAAGRVTDGEGRITIQRIVPSGRTIR